MSLATFLRQLLMPQLPEPSMSDDQVMADASLAFVAENINNLAALPQDEQSRVYKVVIDNGLILGELRIIHHWLQSSAYSDANAIKGYVFHKADAKRLGMPMRPAEVVLREYIKSVGAKSMIRHCKDRPDLKIGFGEIFGKVEAIKAFGRDYEHSSTMEM